MARTVALDLLDSLKIASPCTADWDAMPGDDRVRHCGQCDLNVYNLSAMPAEAAAALVQSKEGRLCVRMHKRADGTVIAQDCPVGLRLMRKKAAKAVGRIAAAAALLITGGLAAATGSRSERMPRLAGLQPFSTIRGWFTGTPVQSGQVIMMGDVCPPPIAPTVAPAPPAPQ